MSWGVEVLMLQVAHPQSSTVVPSLLKPWKWTMALTLRGRSCSWASTMLWIEWMRDWRIENIWIFIRLRLTSHQCQSGVQPLRWRSYSKPHATFGVSWRFIEHLNLIPHVHWFPPSLKQSEVNIRGSFLYEKLQFFLKQHLSDVFQVILFYFHYPLTLCICFTLTIHKQYIFIVLLRFICNLFLFYYHKY